MTNLVKQMCEAGAYLSSLSLSPGNSGNISVRVGEEIYLSPSGSSLGELDADHLSVISIDSQVMRHRSGPRPSKEYGLHEALYRRDNDATCVVHLHSPYAVAASCLPAWAPHSALAPLTPYLLMRLGNLPLVPYGPPGDADQARDLRDLDIPCHGVLLQNHGPVVAGATVDEAVARAIEIEQAAHTVLAVGDRPDAHLLSDNEAERLAANYGQPWGATPPA